MAARPDTGVVWPGTQVLFVKPLTSGAVIFWFAVTLSNVTSFFVATVNSLPFCVMETLSPSINLTVSPP